jgi:two-component sensor histidine kinase
MRTLIPGINTNRKHEIDFSLVPVAIILIEFSVFITQLSSTSSINIGNLVWLRFIHTVAMIFTSTLVSQSYIWLKKPALSYRTLAGTGLVVMAIGDLLHGYLASALGFELISFYRRIGIITVQGILWFPAFMIVASYRKEIFQQLKEYEQRLIVSTRLRSRTSKEFAELQRVIQSRIKGDLFTACNGLKGAIAKIAPSKEMLVENNNSMQLLLSGEELRNLSRRLDHSSASNRDRTFLGLNLRSFKLLVQQSRILYATSIRIAPLPKSAYVLVLIAIATPPYIYFYSFTESLLTYPLLLFFVLVFANLLIKSQTHNSPHKILNSSVLIYLIGLLPLLANLIGQAIYHNPQTQFPILITALALPLTYYLTMTVFQVLRPHALSLIRNDKIEASSILQRKVTQIISDEFSQNLSHKWAVFIHGKILTRLAATALKLETSAKNDDLQSFKKSIESLLSLLDTPDAEFEREITDLQTEVTNRLNPWMGLLDIHLQIDPDLKTIRDPRVQEIGEVIEELITNSVRHGKAKKMQLSLMRSDQSDLTIIAIDNSTTPPPVNSQRSGLGTRIFNLASDGRWAITRVGSSTQFRLTMGFDI